MGFKGQHRVLLDLVCLLLGGVHGQRLCLVCYFCGQIIKRAGLVGIRTFLGRDFVISNTFTWENLYQAQKFALALFFCTCGQGKKGGKCKGTKEGKIYGEVNQRAKKRVKQ